MTGSQSTGDDDDDSDDDNDDGSVRRRWVIRLLVGLGIGIPILIEARTFLGLLGSYLLGEDDDTGTATPTPTARTGIGVGDELLAETAPTETVRTSQIRVRESDWQFEMTVEVENTAGSPYELRLGNVHTTGGETVAGGASTGRIPPGETAFVNGTWVLPTDQRPETLTVTALTFADDVRVTSREVRLAGITFRG